MALIGVLPGLYTKGHVMGIPVIQHSFNSGEWAPALNARVDLQKYHQGAALLLNFFVDYRGGASTRPGTKYILQCYKSSTAVRLISFQASFTVSYVLEFGNQYIRFYNNGAVVLESTKAITGITRANPASVTAVAHGYSTGETVFIASVGGMTQVNNKYFNVVVTGANTYTLTDLNGAAIDSSAYTAYTSGGTSARVYTLPSPYLSADLSLIKFAQNVNTMVLTHPSYAPYLLSLISAANWTLTTIQFGASILAPTGVGSTTTLAAGNVNYAYVVTAVDVNGQESGPSTSTTLLSKQDLRAVAGTNSISWTARSGASYYNIYKAELSYTAAVPSGAAFGYIGFTQGVSFDDSNISADFSSTPPVSQNPFIGAGVASYTVTVAGAYTTVPTVTIGAAPATGITATAYAVLQVQGTPVIGAGGSNYSVGDAVQFPNGVTLIVATVSGTTIATFQPITYPGSNPGSIASGATPANPVSAINVPPNHSTPTATIVYGVGLVLGITPGAGYTSAPAVTFSAGAAAATSSLSTTSSANPAVPVYFDQRLVLAGPTASPQQFNMSKPGSYFNYDVSFPTQPDDAIQGTLVSGQLNTIKSMLPMPSGLIIFSDRAAWQVDGGGNSVPIDATNATAHSQAYNGASDVQPILATFDILYVQSKGSVVRDLSYNLYANIFTGTDISVLSSHLFYGYTITGWAFAEEPFKVVHAIRSDGALLNLTFMKEQELIAWTHSTTNGLFKSIAVVTEAVSFGSVDAVYCVVQRTINGNTVQYVERFAERIFTNGAQDAWCVDAGLQYNGVPAASFTGGEHLAGATVTGLADGTVITPFVMPTNGNFTLGAAASKVTVGLAYTCDLQTLQLDIGEPTIQGKEKKISAVTVRVEDTLGLKIGKTFSSLVAMKDLVLGNVGSATNEIVTGLVTGDAMTIIDPSWTVPGQYCIRQDQPLPASILGVIPQITVGNTAK